MDPMLAAAYGAAVIGLVQIGKSLGLASTTAPLLAGVAGLALLGLRAVFPTVADMLVLGLGATGVYALIGKLSEIGRPES